MIRPTLVLLLALSAVPVQAQQAAAPAPLPSDVPALSLRPFFAFTDQRAAAHTSFDAVFGSANQVFWGGGLQVAFRDGVFVEVAASRFKKTGEQAFMDQGNVFTLGIPQTITVTPLEFSAGYRFTQDGRARVVPYGGGGIGSYSYHQESTFADPSENVDMRHVGYLVMGGVELRVHRWVGVSVDAQYTHIPGILGTAGISKDAGETDLGGIAARVRVLVGR